MVFDKFDSTSSNRTFLKDSNQGPKSSLKNNTSDTNTQHGKRPAVSQLLQFGPEAVLLLAILFKLLRLDSIVLGVSLGLTLFVLPITTDITQEYVVGDWTKSSDRMEDTGAEEKNRERGVD